MGGKLLRGFVDGALSTLGIVVGASSASPLLIVAAAAGGTLANGISNALGAFSAERADDYAELRRVEKAMVDREMKESMLEHSMHRRSMVAGGVDALGTISGGALPLIPYLVGSGSPALIASIALVIVSVSAVGLYLGKLSKRNLVFSACKMAVSGGVVAAVVYGIQWAIVPS